MPHVFCREAFEPMMESGELVVRYRARRTYSRRTTEATREESTTHTHTNTHNIFWPHWILFAAVPYVATGEYHPYIPPDRYPLFIS